MAVSQRHGTRLTPQVCTAAERVRGAGAEVNLTLPDDINQQLNLAAQAAAQDHRELYERCIPARDELLDAANKYRKKAKQPLIDATTTHTWGELDEGVTAACGDLEKLTAEDNKKLTGPIGRVRQAFRSLCRHAGAGQTMISLVPGDLFGLSSVLCAGFKAIFSAMHQMALYRDEIFKALEELPSLLQDSSELCGYMFLENDEALHRRRADLCTAVFQALRHILLWFVKNSLVTSIKMVVDPTGFSERLKERTDIVKLRSQRFQSQVLKLHLLLQVQSLQIQHLTAQEVKAIAAQTKHIESQMMQSRLATFDMLEKINTLVQSSANAGEFLKALPILAEQLKTTHQHQLPGCPSAVADEILRDFCYEPDMVYHDCENILRLFSPSRRQRAEKDFDEERVVAIQSSARLRAWLMLDQPSMLFLNGRCNSQPKSEVSLVSAKIGSRLLELHGYQEVRQEKDAPRFIPLLFFCGEHRDWRRDANGSPAELGMSLLLQLVDRGRGIIPRQALERFRDKTLPEDVDSVCASLRGLIGSLQGRRNVFVVIIIDGIKFFCQPVWREQQTRKVLSTLTALFRGQLQDASRPATLKFLFTTTARTEALEDLFDSDEILHIQRSLPGKLPDNDARLRGLLEFSG